MIQPVGYFSLWRELFSKPIWLKSTPEQKTILITLLAMANFKPNKWEWEGKKFELNPGQFITSNNSIMENCGSGISRQNIRSALARFEKHDFLTMQSTKTGMLVTINNWALYQSSGNEPNQQTNQEVTKSQPLENKVNKTNKKNTEDFFESIWNLYPNKKGKGKVKDTQKKVLYELGIETISKCIERYTKDKPDWQAYQHGSSFFNTGYEDYLDTNYSSQQKEFNNPYREVT